MLFGDNADNTARCGGGRSMFYMCICHDRGILASLYKKENPPPKQGSPALVVGC